MKATKDLISNIYKSIKIASFSATYQVTIRILMVQ